jgi:hypothetical protein
MENINICPMDNLISFVIYKGTHNINLIIASPAVSVDGLNALTPARLYIFIARNLHCETTLYFI